MSTKFKPAKYTGTAKIALYGRWCYILPVIRWSLICDRHPDCKNCCRMILMGCAVFNTSCVGVIRSCWYYIYYDGLLYYGSCLVRNNSKGAHGKVQRNGNDQVLPWPNWESATVVPVLPFSAQHKAFLPRNERVGESRWGLGLWSPFTSKGWKHFPCCRALVYELWVALMWDDLWSIRVLNLIIYQLLSFISCRYLLFLSVNCVCRGI